MAHVLCKEALILANAPVAGQVQTVRFVWRPIVQTRLIMTRVSVIFPPFSDNNYTFWLFLALSIKAIVTVAWLYPFHIWY